MKTARFDAPGTPHPQAIGLSKCIFQQADLTDADVTDIHQGRASGQAACIMGTDPGPVTVDSGGALWVSGGMIGGPLTSSDATAFSLCGTLGVVQLNSSGGISQVNANRLLACYSQTVAAGTRPSQRLARTYGGNVLNPSLQTDTARPLASAGGTVDLRDDVEAQAARRNAYFQAASLRAAEEVQARINVTWAPRVITVDIQVAGLGQSVRRVTYDVSLAGVPHIAIVETWQTSSFLGLLRAWPHAANVHAPHGVSGPPSPSTHGAPTHLHGKTHRRSLIHVTSPLRTDSLLRS